MTLRFEARRRAFTLVEVLIVLVVLGILAAILLPVLSRTREGARQTTCASNLHSLWTAVRLYRSDNMERYPASLLDLVPPNVAAVGSSGGSDPGMLKPPPDVELMAPNSGGQLAQAGESDSKDGVGGYLRSLDGLYCPNTPENGGWRTAYDSMDTSLVPPPASGFQHKTSPVWNYLGYHDTGVAFRHPVDAIVNTQSPSGKALLVDPSQPYDQFTNPIAASLSNRFADPRAIITHCRFHRTQTSRLSTPEQLYLKPDLGRGARDVVLRLDGSAQSIDVSNFRAQRLWQKVPK